MGDSRDQSQDDIWLYSVKVRYSSGKDVPFTLYGQEQWKREKEPNKRGRWTEHELKPGESVEDLISLGKYYDLTIPGKYVVSAKRKVQGAGGTRAEAASNELEFSVTE